jgi:hypothetical protein
MKKGEGVTISEKKLMKGSCSVRDQGEAKRRNKPLGKGERESMTYAAKASSTKGDEGE